jgi:hypothetical protein
MLKLIFDFTIFFLKKPRNQNLYISSPYQLFLKLKTPSGQFGCDFIVEDYASD